MVLYGLALLPASLCPTVLGVAGPAYFYGALLLGLGFVAVTARAAWQRTPRAARQLFFASSLYLPVLLGLMVLDPVSVTATGSTATSAASAPVEDGGRLPEFSLMDHRGAPFTRRQLTGRVSIADFIFTRCAGQCPMMHDRMRKVARALAGEAELQLLSFSVDPAHDTLETLAAFAGTVTGGEARWRFITGDERAVAELAGKGFRLAAGGEGSVEEPITHSTRLVLIDRGGHVRGYYDAADADATDRLARDARQLLRAP
jgi:protein SCO1/2